MKDGINDQIGAVLKKHDLTVESEFVPWSCSRNAGEKMPSLNWKVTLKQAGRVILTTDYMAGMGHCPAYKSVNPFRLTMYDMEPIKAECETGLPHKHGSVARVVPTSKNKIQPESRDVIYSLLMDSEVLQYSGFEEWAREFGYDEDSRKGEQVYNACMKIALQFNRLGESVISELREAFQEY